MPRSTAPRKAHRPRPPNPTSFIAAMQGAAALTLDDRILRQSALAEALAAVRTGRATRAQWAAIFDAINLAEALCGMGLARDAEGVVPGAQAAVVGVMDRTKAAGVRAARAEELRALTDLVAAYADLLAGITHSQLYDAEARVAARMRRVLRSRGTPEPGVAVLDAATLATATARAVA